MLCERCNKKKATVFYRENIGGQVKALRLCGDCTELLEQTGELEDVSAAVAGFISPFFAADDGIFSFPLMSDGTETRPLGTSPQKKCPSCGTTAQDLTRTGRVGCAVCYAAFSEEMAGRLGMIPGRAEHTGRVSAGYRAKAEKAERLVKLKKQLKEAVSNEQYESAAALRDKIRGLEAEL